MENHLQTKDWGLGLKNEHLIIAGPCSAETPEQIEKVCQDMITANVIPDVSRKLLTHLRGLISLLWLKTQ